MTDDERNAIAGAVDPDEVDSLRRAMFPYDDDTVNDDESVNDDQTRRTPRCFEVACLRGLDDARLLAAALIRPAPGEGILGRYVEMPFIVTLPHARGRGLWRELTRELIAWTVRRAAWRATALIVKVKRGGGGVKRKRDKKRGDRHWQETMWRDGAGAVRVDGGWGGARRGASNARERIEAILERLGSNTGGGGGGRRPGSDGGGGVGAKTSAAGSLHPIPDRDLLLIRMLPPPDEGSDATTSPLAPSASSRRVPSFADLDEMRGRRLAQGGPSSPAAGLDSREHASLLDFVTRVVNGRRGCSLSLFGYYEPTAGGSGQPQGVPAALRLRVRDLDDELLGSGGGPGTFLACAHASLLRETISKLLPGCVVDWGAWSDVVSQGNFPAAVEEFLARRRRLAAAQNGAGNQSRGADRPPPPTARPSPSPGPTASSSPSSSASR